MEVQVHRYHNECVYRIPHSHPHRFSQCLVITILCHNTFVRNRSITILGESNPTPALMCNPGGDATSAFDIHPVSATLYCICKRFLFYQVCVPVRLL